MTTIDIQLKYLEQSYVVLIDQGIALSSIVSENGYKAWYVGSPEIVPFKDATFVADAAKGSPVNFKQLSFYPHAHGTHTETVGHISTQNIPITAIAFPLLQAAYVLNCTVEKRGEDELITRENLPADLPEVVVLNSGKTYPRNHNFSNTNAPYLCSSLVTNLLDKGVKHLLLQEPSVDKEKDDGALQNHKAFWATEARAKTCRTKTR